jgi:hypothetical protein
MPNPIPCSRVGLPALSPAEPPSFCLCFDPFPCRQRSTGKVPKRTRLGPGSGPGSPRPGHQLNPIPPHNLRSNPAQPKPGPTFFSSPSPPAPSQQITNPQSPFTFPITKRTHRSPSPPQKRRSPDKRTHQSNPQPIPFLLHRSSFCIHHSPRVTSLYISLPQSYPTLHTSTYRGSVP